MAFFITIFIIFLCAFTMQLGNAADNNFNTYYSYLWGSDHFSVDPQGTEVQLKLDRSSGAGFRSKLEYGSGLFHIRIKIPDKKTGGLTSAPDNQAPGNHFELDFEFPGTNGSMITNVFDNDSGHREQKFQLWFDPSKDFHTYEILWNPHQIVFFVDNIPIRVFKNNMAQGITYPSTPMHIEASIWDAEAWAGPVDWAQAPFIAHYQDFGFNACPGDVSKCGSQQYFWNGPNYWELSPAQKQQMEDYRGKYITYDYCNDHSNRKKECSFNV
ncbi:hypothetical protein DH2020_005250 [Rehmannia glutinosa]|uniref:Xyloglucan endotransglucosylase/hydrolase n=1 Tax=Rehmannia glutinosa TaxID=99300 RepID=A0ABR0XG49_REHGL